MAVERPQSRPVLVLVGESGEGGGTVARQQSPCAGSYSFNSISVRLRGSCFRRLQRVRRHVSDVTKPSLDIGQQLSTAVSNGTGIYESSFIAGPQKGWQVSWLVRLFLYFTYR